MNQTKTTEYFPSVIVGVKVSTPLTMSPSKSGDNNWSKQVANRKLVIVSAPKH